MLAGVVDYAGLYPPASLEIDVAAENYARYRVGMHAWMLGRFVLPATKLGALEAATWAGSFAPGIPWHLSVVLASINEMALVEENNSRAEDGGPALVADAVEIRADSAAHINAISDRRMPGVVVYVELPVTQDPVSLIESAGQAGLFAKVRSGGVTEDAFPSPENLVRFMRRCVEMAVPFKATAGLHHPVRASYPLTYQRGCAKGPMFGFLNVLLSVLLLRRGDSARALEAIREEDASSIRADPESVSWRGTAFLTSEIAAARRCFHSFGSCSFEEPVNELLSLRLL